MLLMRHKSSLMTQRYAHHYSESLRDGVDVLDRISIELVPSGVKEIAAGLYVIVRLVDE
jgi:hypothetical protein